jgi:hypothetical protein
MRESVLREFRGAQNFSQNWSEVEDIETCSKNHPISPTPGKNRDDDNDASQWIQEEGARLYPDVDELTIIESQVEVSCR